MIEMGKPFLQKSDENLKKKQNQFQNAACEEKFTSEKWKFGSNKKLGLERTLNGLEKPFRKKIRSKKLNKRVKIKRNCRM